MEHHVVLLEKGITFEKITKSSEDNVTIFAEKTGVIPISELSQITKLNPEIVYVDSIDPIEVALYCGKLIGKGEPVKIYTNNEGLLRVINKEKGKIKNASKKHPAQGVKEAPPATKPAPEKEFMNKPVEKNTGSAKTKSSKVPAKHGKAPAGKKLNLNISEGEIKKILKENGYDETLSKAICLGIEKAENDLTVDVMIRIELAKTDIDKKIIPDVASLIKKAIGKI